MKGRALLHHDVQLDDRATLNSVPGIKDGTILRVDKQLSPVKSKSNGKKVMSGPATSAVDEDVMDSIENSGDDKEISSEGEWDTNEGERKRRSLTSLATMEDVIDDDEMTDSPWGNDPPNTADTNFNNSAIPLRITKHEKSQSAPRDQSDILTSQPQNFTQGLHTPNNPFAPPPQNPANSSTTRAQTSQNPAAVSSHQDLMEDVDSTFLAGINNAAAIELDRPPLHPETGPEDAVSARRCGACGRACGCGRHALAASECVVPVEGRGGGDIAASGVGTSDGHLMAKGTSASKDAESSWTGMW